MQKSPVLIKCPAIDAFAPQFSIRLGREDYPILSINRKFEEAFCGSYSENHVRPAELNCVKLESALKDPTIFRFGQSDAFLPVPIAHVWQALKSGLLNTSRPNLFLVAKPRKAGEVVHGGNISDCFVVNVSWHQAKQPNVTASREGEIIDNQSGWVFYALEPDNMYAWGPETRVYYC